MRAFLDLEVTDAIVDEIARHGEEVAPVEACGLVLGRPGVPELARVVRMKNVQDKYHARDPAAFPRDGRDAFRLDELERMRVLEAAEAEGLVERILYHSHCEAGAYFSPEDRAMAVREGVELMPGVCHLVVAIRGGRRNDMAMYRWDGEKKAFREARIPIDRAHAGQIPELSLRTMDSREAVRPIRPVGGSLGLRRVTREEQQVLSELSEGRKIGIDDAAIADVARFEFGLYSPLAGFLRSVEARAVLQTGHLFSGVPWRVPVTLDVARCMPIESGSIVELVDARGTAHAAVGIDGLELQASGQTRVSGPVYAYESGAFRDAAESRAELLRLGAKRVLAVTSAHAGGLRGANLQEFDAILAGGTSTRPASAAIADHRIVLPFPMEGRDPWLDAVMAQNLGATHVWVLDPTLARTIADTLAITPWRP